MSLRKVDNVLELIGRTPLVAINRLNPNPSVEVLAKLEYFNPGGSVKDRIAISMIEAAERSGELTPAKTILEPTSGNTGIGLAMVAAVKGYKLVLCMSESASEERRKILKAYGAQILLTPGHLGTDGAIEEAYRLAREEPERYFCPDQFNNDANWLAHYNHTADEIYEACQGKVDVVVLTMGTTGTLMGVARRLREHDPNIRIVGVEPYLGHKIQGLKNMKEAYTPGIFQRSEPDEIVNVEDDLAYETARRLAREEGIFVGMSAGAAMRVALDEAAKLASGRVVTLLPDGGERYLSTPLFVSEKVPVPLRFYNTLSRQMEELRPLVPGQVGIYACGPSLDGPPDLGLCRRMVFADLLKRYLLSRGFAVKLVINIADIDDRTINQALKEKANHQQFVTHWQEAFFEDMAKLAVEPADAYPKAGEQVPEMIAQTKQLLDKGLAYEKLRSVYFKISALPDYGRLSGVKLGDVRTIKPSEADSYDKDDPRDFALFKRSTLAELKAGIYWNTPWGNVRPGWHVECACMSRAELGETFDIHLASTDLIFPHGDNEIAIAAALTGKPLANLWMHCEVVMADGRKVNRAAGNEVTLRDLLKQGHSPLAVRYWLLCNHYRHDTLQYNQRNLAWAAATVRRLNDFVHRLRCHPPGQAAPDLRQHLFEARQRFQEAMDLDLNVPRAMGHVFTFLRRANRLMGQGLLDSGQIELVLKAMGWLNDVIGVIDLAGPAADPEIDSLVTQRSEARQKGDWHTADRLRQELSQMGVELIDTRHGTRWRRL